MECPDLCVQFYYIFWSKFKNSNRDTDCACIAALSPPMNSFLIISSFIEIMKALLYVRTQHYFINSDVALDDTRNEHA